MRPTWILAACLLTAGLSASACASARREPVGPRSASHPVRPLVARGDRFRRSGREEDALGFYACAVQRDPDSVPAHLRYIATLSETGRRSEARRVYEERAARRDATDVDVTMAQRLSTNGSSSALRRVYALASERSPRNVWWRLAQAEVEIAEAEAWNRKRLAAMDRGDRDEERAAHTEAHAALRRASEHVERASVADQRLAEVDLYRGYLRAVEGDLHSGAAARTAAYRAAAAAFRRAVDRDPDLVEAWEGLGDVSLRTDETRESIAAFVEAAKLAPADPHLRMSVGVVLHRIGRTREAAEQFQQAAVLSPGDATPWMMLGDARAEDERWDETLAAYDQALHRDASVVDAHYKKATVYEHLGRLGEARAAYELYLSQGGERTTLVRRRVDRLLRDVDRRPTATPNPGLPPPVVRVYRPVGG